jgi:putative peptide zinc metalloprotease protein
LTSALEARPRLRPDVKLVRREVHGEVNYVAKEPDEGKYYQFREREGALMQLMDGRRTPADIADEAERLLGLRWAPGNIADFAQMLKRMGLVERTPAEQRLMLLERVRRERKTRSQRKTKGSALRMTYSIGDPNRLLGWMVDRMRWAWTRPFVLLSLALFAIYTVILVTAWEPFWDATKDLYLLRGFGPWDFFLLYVVMVAVAIIHEFGHGLTTKAFGGDVREMGGMLIYFQPALFCNTSDAWLFRKRSHRIWVTLGGPWIGLLVAAAAAIVWITTEPGTFINKIALFAFIAGGALSVLTNFNPLIPLDGYYALADYLEIPNMRERAFEYWGWLAKRTILGIAVAEPTVTPRERRIFLIYGGLAIVYSAFAMIVGLWWLIAVIGRLIGPIVWLIVAVTLLKKVVKLSVRGQALARATATSWRAGFLRGSRFAVLIAALAALVLLAFLTPWTSRARGEFLVEAAPRAQVRAQTSGILDAWQVGEGATVSVGQPIARLWNAELERTFLELDARAKQLRLKRYRAETRGDLAEAASFASVLNEVEAQLGVLVAQRERLTVRSPIEGTVIGYRLSERIGEAIDAGDLLVEVASANGRLARVRVPLKEAGEMEAGQSAALKLHARPDVKFVSTVSAVAPAAQSGWLEAEVPLPANGPQPAPGMTGIAKISTRRGTIAQAVARAIKQTLRIDLWL